MNKRSRRYFQRKKDLKEIAWMCPCGHYEESDLHCSVCSNEPPWGCPCDFCQNGHWDDDDEEDMQYEDEMGMPCPYDDADQQYDDEPEIAGYGCLICGHRQGVMIAGCDKCGSDMMDEIYM